MISAVCWDEIANPGAWSGRSLMKAYRYFLIFLMFSAAVSGAEAADFVVKDIQVEGLQRISAGTVFNYLPVQVGSTVSEKDYPELIRALFKTGFFADVNLERRDNVLVAVSYTHLRQRFAVAWPWWRA